MARNLKPPIESEMETVIGALWPAPAPNSPFTILGRDETEETRSHGEIVDEAVVAATGLVRRGVNPGDRVGAIARHTFDFVIGCLAVWRAGATLVPLPPPAPGISRSSWAAMVGQRLAKVRANLIIGDSSDPRLGGLRATTTADLTNAGDPSIELPDVRPDDVAAIQFSSGSTSVPKGIVISHRSLLSRLDRTRGGLSAGKDHRVLRWTPLHFSGMLAITQPIGFGYAHVMLPTQLFLQDPSRWLVEISRRRITDSGGGSFAYGLAARAMAKGLPESVDLSSWRLANCTWGEAPDLETLRRFVEVARPLGFREDSLTASYAITEAGNVSRAVPGSGLKFLTVDRGALADGRVVPAAPSDRASTLVSSGVVHGDAELRVVSSEDHDLPERRIGEFLVRISSMFDGYLDDPQATSNAFADDWLRTGDLGFVDEGEVYVTGRSKDIIIVHGRNFHPQDIEGIVRGALAEEGAKCAAFGVRSGASEAVVLAIESTARGVEAEETRRRIVRRVSAATGVTVRDVVLVEPGSLPTTSSGKLRRSLTKERYEKGSL